jgi:hypothetical protein
LFLASLSFSTFRMEAKCFSETSVTFNILHCVTSHKATLYKVIRAFSYSSTNGFCKTGQVIVFFSPIGSLG